MTNRIDEIKAKWAAASPRPWKRGTGYEQSDPGNYVYSGCGAIVCAQQDGTDCDLRTEDAIAIADAPADVAFLLEEVERLTMALATWDGPVAASDEELGEFYRRHWESVAGPIGAIREGFQLGVLRTRAERDKARKEIERLEKAAARRRIAGIWPDAEDRTKLAVWYDGGERVVAESAEDALAVWAEFNGCDQAEHDDFDDGDVFERVPDEETITINMGEDGLGPPLTLTARQWALVSGRSWLCTENL
ncbi:MAG: hypothetical protein MUF34_30765 [Polyangiaceae bacterium]|jgi:hypothetical protein|nr:hypothetical protein [Polyangiaceae bacterium]